MPEVLLMRHVGGSPRQQAVDNRCRSLSLSLQESPCILGCRSLGCFLLCQAKL